MSKLRAILLLLGLSAAFAVAAKSEVVVTGTGNFSATVTEAEAQSLEPACVQLLSRFGTWSFSGLIEGSGGPFDARVMRNLCVSPVQGTFNATATLEDVTISGRTGTLQIEITGIADEPTASSTPSRFSFTVRGLSGGLKDAVGVGVGVGLVTDTGSFNTYYARITLP